MLVFCDHLWSFLSFLLCLVSHPAPAKWDLNPFFQEGQNCWKGFKGEAALSLAVVFLTVLVSCCSLLPTTAPSALAWGDLAPRHTLLSAHPG